MRDVFWIGPPVVAALALLVGAFVGRTMYLWTIEHEGRAIGHCYMRQIDRREGHATAAMLIGDRSEQGRGLAAEASTLRNEFAFGHPWFNKMKASAFTENVASHRLLERAGYRRVSTAKGPALRGGRPREVLLFELTRADYERVRAARAE
jgi:RimJ/RimL family protein N-acetyltransferase